MYCLSNNNNNIDDLLVVVSSEVDAEIRYYIKNDVETLELLNDLASIKLI